MKELKELVFLGLELGNAVGKSLEDKKLDLADAVYLWPVLQAAPAAVEDASKALAEAKAASPSDWAILVEEAKVKFDLADDDKEKAVEAAMDAAVCLVKAVSYFRK